jgi:hypothetical protein
MDLPVAHSVSHKREICEPQQEEMSKMSLSKHIHPLQKVQSAKQNVVFSGIDISKDQDFTTLIGENGKVYYDPRGDWIEDSALWLELFILADTLEPKLYQALLACRCCGARLVLTETGTVIKPTISEDGWKTIEQYEEDKRRWLVPHKDLLINLLKKISPSNPV